jgi:hypothetical protein
MTNRYTESKLEALKRMPYTGLLKDTVLLPAGGAVALRFEVNNPGVWFAHCHILLHKEDGMAFIIREGGAAAARAVKLPPDYPICLPHETQSMYPSCQCKEDTDQLQEHRLKHSWVCSRDWLCHHDEKYAVHITNPMLHQGIAFHGINSNTHVVLCGSFAGMAVIGLVAYWIGSVNNAGASKSGQNPCFATASCIHRVNEVKYRYTNHAHSPSGPDDVGPSNSRVKDIENSESENSLAASIHSTERIFPIDIPVDNIFVELLCEWKQTHSEIVNLMRCVEVVSLAVLTGCVFYRVGEDTTYRGLRESISLLFFSVTLWTFTRMYPAIPAHHLWRERVIARLVRTNGSWRSVVTLSMVRSVVYLCAEGWWPALFGLIVYPIAHMNHNTGIWFQNIAFLALNNLCYISFGAVLGSAMPNVQLGMVNM